MRGRPLWLVTEMRRSSAGSSGETTISGPYFEIEIDAPEHGAIRSEADLVVHGLLPGRLEGGGPDVSGLEIADVAEIAPVVAGDILAPARQRQRLPPAVPAAGVGDHHRVVAVREHVGSRAQRMRRDVAADQRRRQRARGRDVLRLLDRRVLERDDVRDALLQQEVRCLHAWVGMKPALHRRRVQHVVECNEAHPHVMRHVGRQDGAALPFGDALGRVVDRLVVAVDPGHALGVEFSSRLATASAGDTSAARIVA